MLVCSSEAQKQERPHEQEQPPQQQVPPQQSPEPQVPPEQLPMQQPPQQQPQHQQQHLLLPQQPAQQLSGTGWGGVWTAGDDFVAQRRRTKWTRQAGASPLPPRLYVDNKTIIREVMDVCNLRRGDHCLIPINVLRSLSPAIDRWISLLGSFELIYFYHHFIILDDVAYIDDHGVPRTSTGDLAMIMEYGNTIPEAVQEVREAMAGNPLALPGAAIQFVFCHKSKCHRMSLADYGDTPHIYIVVENLTSEDRERIVKNAACILQNPARYHVFKNNCEHLTNHISSGHRTSPNMHFALWNWLRSMLCCVGLVSLSIAAGSCYNQLCISYPLGAMIAFYTFSTMPVLAQAAVSYVLIVRNVGRQYARALIDRDDYYHLLAKEGARMLVVGGGATVATATVPHLVTRTQCLMTACGLCAFAYLMWDLIYNCCAHAVMRLVLLPKWGKVWLIGAAPQSGGCHAAKMD